MDFGCIFALARISSVACVGGFTGKPSAFASFHRSMLFAMSSTAPTLISHTCLKLCLKRRLHPLTSPAALAGRVPPFAALLARRTHDYPRSYQCRHQSKPSSTIRFLSTDQSSDIGNRRQSRLARQLSTFEVALSVCASPMPPQLQTRPMWREGASCRLQLQSSGGNQHGMRCPEFKTGAPEVLEIIGDLVVQI
eukprot:SAG31_NODE_275_length_18666_cov_8.489309_6_plen_194_part_00